MLANYLKNEYPQTVAVVLSESGVPSVPARSAGIAAGFVFAMEAGDAHVAHGKRTEEDVLDGVEKTLRAEFMSNLARSTRRDAHEMMADIFNNLDRAGGGPSSPR